MSTPLVRQMEENVRNLAFNLMLALMDEVQHAGEPAEATLAFNLMLALMDEVRHAGEPAEATMEVLAKAQAEFGCKCNFVELCGWVVSADCPYHD